MPDRVILIAAVTVDGYIARHNLEITNWSQDLKLFKDQLPPKEMLKPEWLGKCQNLRKVYPVVQASYKKQENNCNHIENHKFYFLCME